MAEITYRVNHPRAVDVAALGRLAPPGEEFTRNEPLDDPADVALLEHGALVELAATSVRRKAIKARLAVLGKPDDNTLDTTRAEHAALTAEHAALAGRTEHNAAAANEEG